MHQIHFGKVIYSALLLSIFALLTLPVLSSDISLQPSDSSATTQDTIKHSPRAATWMSAFVPGLGQIYNRKYWKAPVIWGGMAFCSYQAMHNQILYREYRNAYADLLQPTPDTSLTNILINKYHVIKPEYGQLPEQVIFYKTQYQSNMNISYIFLIGIYVLNIIDAMVDAHFYDFDINDNLSFRINPDIQPLSFPLNAMSIRCSITF